MLEHNSDGRKLRQQPVAKIGHDCSTRAAPHPCITLHPPTLALTNTEITVYDLHQTFFCSAYLQPLGCQEASSGVNQCGGGEDEAPGREGLPGRVTITATGGVGGGGLLKGRRS